jgi:hypothetical protein
MTVMLDAELRKALAGEMTPKFLATLDASGQPNCVPVVSIMPYEGDTLVFGEFLMQKSRSNLLQNDKVGVAVLNDAFEGWSVKGTFLGFETQGERVDFVNRLPMLRYNAYTSVRAAGRIRIEAVSRKMCLSKGRLLFDFLRVSALAKLSAGASNGRRCMPRPVEEKFRRMQAVRAMAFRDDDGFPRAFPVMACVAAGSNRLLVQDPLFAAYERSMPEGVSVAVAVITTEPIAYQVKGRYQGKRLRTGVIDLAECFSASPPLLGERLDS